MQGIAIMPPTKASPHQLPRAEDLARGVEPLDRRAIRPYHAQLGIDRDAGGRGDRRALLPDRVNGPFSIAAGMFSRPK